MITWSLEALLMAYDLRFCFTESGKGNLSMP